MNLCDTSRSFITFINLCYTKNMINLYNLELDKLSGIFLHKDLLDSNFQDTIIKVLYIEKSF
jgi:hypothetical protein